MVDYTERSAVVATAKAWDALEALGSMGEFQYARRHDEIIADVQALALLAIAERLAELQDVMMDAVIVARMEAGKRGV